MELAEVLLFGIIGFEGDYGKELRCLTWNWIIHGLSVT